MLGRPGQRPLRAAELAAASWRFGDRRAATIGARVMERWPHFNGEMS